MLPTPSNRPRARQPATRLAAPRRRLPPVGKVVGPSSRPLLRALRELEDERVILSGRLYALRRGRVKLRAVVVAAGLPSRDGDAAVAAAVRRALQDPGGLDVVVHRAGGAK